MTYEEWKEEQRYIASVNPKAPGGAFNHDRQCFARYCNMQANSCRADGFYLTAHDMTQARDIADPEFRSKIRDAGGVVSGQWAIPRDVMERGEHITDADYPEIPELPEQCEKHGRFNAVTCGGCSRAWCESCDPAPGPLCPFCHGPGISSAELSTERSPLDAIADGVDADVLLSYRP